MAEVNISEDIYNAAKVSLDTNGLQTAFADGFHIEAFYICNLYLAFLIFGGAVGTLIEGIGRKSALAAKGMKAGAVALAGGYVAGAVTLIVQAGQVLP